MNIIIKKQKLENPGIDPGASRMQIERSTIWANPPFALILFTNLFLISSCVAIRNEYNYKETEIGESEYRIPVPLECKSSALPLELIPLVHWFYSPIFSLYPRELHLKMNYNYKEHRNWRIRVSIPVPLECIIERSTTWANPPCALILFTNLFLISSCVAIRNEYNYKETEIGESGYRSRCLSNANQALYHLS